jgi:acyl-CoA synthetase (AMP-forming)/AMP-acid ligase II
MTTLNDLLQQVSESDDSGLRLLDRRERETWLGWDEVARQARRVAASLRTQLSVERGEPIGLLVPTGAAFFAGFFGSLLTGGVPVPLYPPVRLGSLTEYGRRTSRMLVASGARIVLTDQALADTVSPIVEAAGCHGFAVDALADHGEYAAEMDPQDLALIQFSSGTTVDPKPVALTHQALVAQTDILNSFWTDTQEVRHSGVSWLPLYHDMGLIGCVLPALARKTTLTLIRPDVFLARPAIWLRAIARYQATVSPAPCFGYQHCVERIKDRDIEGIDLSSWRVALNGAEFVSCNVMRSFINRFGSCGFRPEVMTPVYGLSEAALAVTFSGIAKPFVSNCFSRQAMRERGAAIMDDGGVELASVGTPVPGFELEIRDPSDGRLPPDRIGRIWTRGPSLMTGYLNDPQATDLALKDGWLDTGDLGFMHGGELYITGRAKDVLIVHGRNHAPEEIEMVVDEVPGVRNGCRAAVGHLPDGADREQIWLLVERQRSFASDQEESLAETCRREVLSRTGIALDRVCVLEPGTLPRTSSGKIRRGEALHLLLRNP